MEIPVENKKVYFFSRRLFQETYIEACGNIVRNILKPLCYNMVEGVPYGSDRHIDREFRNASVIGLLTSEKDGVLILEGMTYLKKKGDDVYITTNEKMKVSGGETENFLYIDLMCANKKSGNGTMLFKAIESLASAERMEKMVLYWVENAKPFWEKMGFVEEPDVTKKNYSMEGTVYLESGTRMEKKVVPLHSNALAYTVVTTPGDLKEMFNRFHNIFRTDVRCEKGKQIKVGAPPVVIGLGLNTAEETPDARARVRVPRRPIFVNVEVPETSNKKIYFFSRKLFTKTFTANCEKKFKEELETICLRRDSRTQDDSKSHINDNFGLSSIIGILISDTSRGRNITTALEAMIFIKKKGDFIKINEELVRVTGGDTDRFLYIDLICAKQGTTHNGSLLYNAVETLARSYQYDKMVLYSAGDSLKFWTGKKFIEEQQEEKKFYQLNNVSYPGPGVRMEKKLTTEHTNVHYEIVRKSDTLKNIFSGISEVFGHEEFTQCCRRIESTEIDIGLLPFWNKTIGTKLLEQDLRDGKIPTFLASALRYTLGAGI